MAKKRTAAEKSRNKENYKALRAAGFSSKDASRLRNASQSKVNAALASGVAHEKSERQSRAGRGLKMEHTPRSAYGYHKGRIKPSDYLEVQKGYTKMYTDKFAYVLTYETRDKDGNYERKYFTVTSSEPKTKKDLVQEMVSVFNQEDNKSEYKAKPVKSSIELTHEIYHNPEFD